MRALITGGAGGVGLHLARKLSAEGCEVTLVDSQFDKRDEALSKVLARSGVHALELDLRIPANTSHIDDGYSHIFHLAALLGVSNVIDRPYVTLDANIAMLTSTIALAHRQSSLQRLVFASTSEVYAGTLEQYGLPFPTPEGTPLTLPPLDRPRTSYMLSKICGEALCFYSGLPITIVRPHNVYGPRMGRSHVVPQMLERAHRAEAGDVFEVPSYEHTRTFCFIDDAIEMIHRLALSANAKGRAVNVGTEQPELTMGQLAELVLTTTGKKLRIKPLMPTQGSPARRAPAMELCRELTGYSSRTTLGDGVRATYDWYRQNAF